MSNAFVSIFYNVFAAFNFEKTAFVRLAQAVNDMPQKLIKDKIHFFSKPCRC